MNPAGGARPLAVSARPRLRFSPERRLGVFVALSSLLWMVPGRAGRIAGGGALALFALLTAIDCALLPPRHALSLARELPENVGIGDSVEGAYTIASRWPRTLVVELADHPSPLVTGGTGSAVVTLGGAASCDLPFRLAGETRGRAPLGPVGARAAPASAS